MSEPPTEEAPRKRRKLRPPGETFQAIPLQNDDPDLHGGRVRTTPHIQGQWPTHLYVNLKAPQELLRALQAIVQSANSDIDEKVKSLCETEDVIDGLHLSLSRPLQLWTGQRQDFTQAVRKALQKKDRFKINLASLACLSNDEKTRSFLTCEVGYGYEHLSSLTELLNDILVESHLPTYYAEPRFHVSLAWWIPSSGEQLVLPERNIKDLEAKYGEMIRQYELLVNSVSVKLGRDVTNIALR